MNWNRKASSLRWWQVIIMVMDLADEEWNRLFQWCVPWAVPQWPEALGIPGYGIDGGGPKRAHPMRAHKSRWYCQHMSGRVPLPDPAVPSCLGGGLMAFPRGELVEKDSSAKHFTVSLLFGRPQFGGEVDILRWVIIQASSMSTDLLPALHT